MSKKKALIITDGTKPIRSIAMLIKGELDGYKVKICPAKRFVVTDLLAAEIFFVGCKRRKPKSFSCLEETLSHINLASRKCGIYSISDKGLAYLTTAMSDSEADISAPFLISEEKIAKAAVSKWVKKLL